MTTATAPRTVTWQPFWSRAAGAGITLGGALLLLAILSVVIGASTRGSSDLDAVTALLLLSTVGQIATGIVYLRHRGRSRR
ncbi:hypothetical protein [Rathayibacter sp. VKM Ac-2857]|uniref:hypothetical protein n=1 Tax=Rathayibacter sp. VKM Ac-2857 TaxID=2739020 RepID=UPI0015661942|nr:hypothetical protein [Rathayibacter sp. VKM Ac-2857]NQX17970.1 hypothetical protein [Rathayibacter sp. VKM Ac-2857]